MSSLFKSSSCPFFILVITTMAFCSVLRHYWNYENIVIVREDDINRDDILQVVVAFVNQTKSFPTTILNSRHSFIYRPPPLINLSYKFIWFPYQLQSRHLWMLFKILRPVQSDWHLVQVSKIFLKGGGYGKKKHTW